jgi:SGNH hydrolase-like domain, acetyltransferase AlgX
LSLSAWLPTGLVFGRRAVTGAALAVIAVSFSLGGSAWAKPAFSLAALGWVGLLLVCLLTTPGKFLRFARSLGRVELVAFNLALTLVLAEASLRLYAAVTGDQLLIRETLDAYRLTPGRDYGNGLRGNQLGYPGPDFRVEKGAGVCRIAALGDSFAVGPAVPFADNYLTRLEKILPEVEVYNFGVSGAGPREYWTILNQHVWIYRPDLVLVSVFVGNDITEWLATPRHMDPRQYATYLLLSRGSRVLRERFRRADRPQEGRAFSTGNPATNGVSFPFSSPGLSVETFDEIEARRLEVCLKASRPGLERKWQRALGYLEAIVGACRKRRVPVFFIVIPDEFQVNAEVLARALQQAGLSAGDIDLDLPQRRLKVFLAEQGAPCLDLLSAFGETSSTYAPCDTHWNVRGNHLAAEQIAKWLVRQNQFELLTSAR